MAVRLSGVTGYEGLEVTNGDKSSDIKDTHAENVVRGVRGVKEVREGQESGGEKTRVRGNKTPEKEDPKKRSHRTRENAYDRINGVPVGSSPVPRPSADDTPEMHGIERRECSHEGPYYEVSLNIKELNGHNYGGTILLCESCLMNFNAAIISSGMGLVSSREQLSWHEMRRDLIEKQRDYGGV
jgi:hypothetical protein